MGACNLSKDQVAIDTNNDYSAVSKKDNPNGRGLHNARHTSIKVDDNK